MQEAFSGKTILITGSNKGLGYGLLKTLAQKDSTKYNFIMAVRSSERAQQALKELANDCPGIEKRTLIQELDVSKSASIDSFIRWVKEHKISIDGLINNAGVMLKDRPFNYETVEETFITNVDGTIELTEKVLPFVNKNGKIIVIGSRLGLLSYLKNEELKRELLSPDLNEKRLKELIVEFKKAVREGTSEKEGWIPQAYNASKAFINVYAEVLARKAEVKEKEIQVNAYSPGYVKTDMTDPGAERTVEEGIASLVWLIEQPWEINEERQGKFIHDNEVLPLDAVHKSKMAN